MTSSWEISRPHDTDGPPWHIQHWKQCAVATTPALAQAVLPQNTCQGAVATDQVLDPECKKPVPFGERCAVTVEGEWNDCRSVGRRDHRMCSVCWRQSITVDQRLKVFQHLWRARELIVQCLMRQSHGKCRARCGTRRTCRILELGSRHESSADLSKPRHLSTWRWYAPV